MIDAASATRVRQLRRSASSRLAYDDPQIRIVTSKMIRLDQPRSKNKLTLKNKLALWRKEIKVVEGIVTW